MTEALALLRSDPRARLFFATLAQSSIGTGVAYPALLVVAYGRFHSPWAISLVLLADFVPAMVLGPFLGAVIDRLPRLWCATAADLVRAAAFVGIALVGTFPATLALALLAGLGTALFRPAALAAIPNMVSSDRSAAAAALFGGTSEFGLLAAGPAIAAAAFTLVGPKELLLANAATFAISMVVLAALAFSAGAARRTKASEARYSLFREARAGLRASLQMPGIRILILGLSVGMFFGGVYNVIELPFATEALGTGVSGYSALVAVYGAGYIAGSLRGSGGGEAARLKHLYLLGLLLTGAGSLAAGASPGLAMAVGAFAVGGFGNGLAIVHQRLLFYEDVPSSLQGRVFSVADALTAWGFAAGFLAAGAAAAASGPRPLLLAAGAGEVMLAAVSAAALRRQWGPGHVPTSSPQPRTS
jgi:MFS family permease